ncbi:hypothetical protein Hanom_Chr07g00644691 [Helianthus anomalus]
MNKVWDTCRVVVQPHLIFGEKMWETFYFYTGSEWQQPYPHNLTRVYKSWNNIIPSFFSFKRLPGYVSFTKP